MLTERQINLTAALLGAGVVAILIHFSNPIIVWIVLGLLTLVNAVGLA